jgi:capsular exopolysaccharide synthesis family protein
MSLALPAVAPTLPSLAEQMLALRRRWRLIGACALLVPLVTAALLGTAPPVFTATGILIYQPEAAPVPGDSNATSLAAENEDAVTASQSAVIASLPAAAAIAETLDLADTPDFNPALASRPWPFSLRKRPAPPSAASLAEAVRRRLSVAVLPGSRILAVSFSAADPALAAKAANVAMQLYVTHERDAAFAALTDAQTWLVAHAQAAQAQLDATETALAQARAAAGVVQGAQASLTGETVSRLAASLAQAQADLAMNQARLASAHTADAAAANAAIAPNLLPLRKEQADLVAQVQSLAQVYGPDYPALRTARTQLAAMSSEITAETSRELDAANAEVAADKAEIATLSAALAGARTASQTEDQESAPIRALEQRAEAGRAMLRNMTLQADQLAQDASLTKSDARLLSAASVPLRPSSPPRSLILAAALALGACAGVLLASLASALDTSFRTGAALRAQLGVNCLAMIPAVKQPQSAALAAPFSLYAEQLRALRTALGLGSAIDSGVGRIIAVTAARPGEGKTTLTIALARALAAAGLRTLAIDGDLRQPSFDAVIGAGGAMGLTDHLSGLATLHQIMGRDPLSPLTIIPAGTQAAIALNLFLTPALPALLADLRQEFDVILLDVPPAYALAEGRVLARLADAALLCIRWGHTPRRVAAGAIELLRESGVTLAGAALTRVDAKAHGKSGFADAEMYQPRYGGYFR